MYRQCCPASSVLISHPISQLFNSLSMRLYSPRNTETVKMFFSYLDRVSVLSPIVGG